MPSSPSQQITSVDLTGSIKVMSLVIGFEDRNHQWPTISNNPSYPNENYPLVGAFPFGITLRDYIAQNGPINVEEWIEPGFETYIEKYSGGKYTADVIFPKRVNGEPYLTINNFQHWITLNGSSNDILDPYKPYVIPIIQEAAYNLVSENPNAFDGINMLQVSFVGITSNEFWSAHGGYTWPGSTTIKNPYDPGEIYFSGPLGVSHTTGPILHEALHNIGTAVGTPGGFNGLPDRGYSTNVINSHGNCTGVYDEMYHSGNSLMGQYGLYGNAPLLPYDLIFLGWIEDDEIIEINNQNFIDLKLANVNDTLSQQQISNGYRRIIKVMIHENYQNDWDEYFLLSFHDANNQELNFDKCLHNIDEGLYNKGVLIWHVKEIRNMINSYYDQQFDLEVAQPYNGYYGNPIPNDNYPRDYSRSSNWNGQWAGDFDWLDDLKKGPDKKYYYLPDGGQHIWETTVPPEIYPGGHFPWDPTGEDWFWRPSSLRSDFFTDEQIRGQVINEMTDVTRPSTKDWAGNRTHIAIKNIRRVNDYMMVDVYYNYWEGEITQNETLSGNVTIGGNLTIPAGKTLTISSGTVLNILDGSSIIVNGTLNANGTSNDRITFDFVAKQSNNGIKTNSGATANIYYSDIQNGT